MATLTTSTADISIAAMELLARRIAPFRGIRFNKQYDVTNNTKTVRILIPKWTAPAQQYLADNGDIIQYGALETHPFRILYTTRFQPYDSYEQANLVARMLGEELPTMTYYANVRVNREGRAAVAASWSKLLEL